MKPSELQQEAMEELTQFFDEEFEDLINGYGTTIQERVCEITDSFSIVEAYHKEVMEEKEKEEEKVYFFAGHKGRLVIFEAIGPQELKATAVTVSGLCSMLGFIIHIAFDSKNYEYLSLMKTNDPKLYQSLYDMVRKRNPEAAKEMDEEVMLYLANEQSKKEAASE